MSELVDEDPGGPLERLVGIAGEQVSGACWASVSQLRGDRFDSDAAVVACLNIYYGRRRGHRHLTISRPA
jgi:hypothetical protein